MNRRGSNKARTDCRFPGFFFFAVFMATVQAALAQPEPVVRSLEISGNAVFSTSELLEDFKTVRGKPFDASLLRQDLSKLRDRYRRAGYLSCSTDSTRSVNVADGLQKDILVVVHEGKQVVIASVDIADSLSGHATLLLDRIHALIGAPFDQAAFEDGIQRMLGSLEQRGYPLASISVGSMSIDTTSSVDSAHVLLSVDEGPQLAITQVKIEGNKATSDGVILREVRLNDRTLYSDERVQEIRRRLQRLQLFSSVSVPEFYITPQGQGGILIKVREGQQNRFDGILGYVPSSTQGEPGYVTGLIDLEFRNLFGTGRRFITHWTRETQTTQDLAVRYREPWVASWPINAEIGFAQRKQDSTYLRRSYDGSAEFMLNDDLTIGLVFVHVSVYPSERLQNPVAASSNTSIGATIRFDARNDPVTPEAGVMYSTAIEVGLKSINSGPQKGTSRTRRVTFDLESYLSFVRGQVVALLLHGRDVESPSLDQSDLFRLGGTATLRGYREAQFFGSSMAWMNAEYRFLLGGHTYAYGFFDVGYSALPDRPDAGLTKSELTRAGYGIGVRVDTRVGLIGVSLGFGEGDTFRTAKLHFRLINEF